MKLLQELDIMIVNTNQTLNTIDSLLFHQHSEILRSAAKYLGKGLNHLRAAEKYAFMQENSNEID